MLRTLLVAVFLLFAGLVLGLLILSKGDLSWLFVLLSEPMRQVAGRAVGQFGDPTILRAQFWNHFDLFATFGMPFLIPVTALVLARFVPQRYRIVFTLFIPAICLIGGWLYLPLGHGNIFFVLQFAILGPCWLIYVVVVLFLHVRKWFGS